MEIKFCGAARNVTGSSHLLTLDNGYRILLDCGLYQGKGRYEDEAKWNMILNQLQLGNKNLVLQNLEFFNNKKSSIIYSDAQEILKALQDQKN